MPTTNQPRITLKCLTVNFNSLKNKKEVFEEILGRESPDIVFGCETWLSPNVLSTEILPPEYVCDQFRNDRPDGYGGVMIALKNNLIGTRLDIINHCEISAAKVNTISGPPIIVCAVYRPPREDLNAAHQICDALLDLYRRHPDSCFWISGDFNLPDIDWTSDSIEGHQFSLALNTLFLDTFQNIGLTQTVDFPTRINNTLDLFLTNRPTFISECNAIPGVSDHEIVVTLSDTSVKQTKPVKRKVISYGKKRIYPN